MQNPAEDETIGVSDIIVDRVLDDPAIVRIQRTSDALVVVLQSTLTDETGVFAGSETIVAVGN